MIIINTTGKHKRDVLIDEENYNEISKRKWIVKISKQKYESVISNYWEDGKKKSIKLANVILNNLNSEKIVDHKNGNTLDNRKQNLRICDSTKNSWNRGFHKNNTTGFKGVRFRIDRGNYIAVIGEKSNYLGTFSSARLAAIRYDIESIKRFGEYARTNGKLGKFKLFK